MFRVGLAVVALLIALGSLMSFHPALNPVETAQTPPPEPVQAVAASVQQVPSQPRVPEPDPAVAATAVPVQPAPVVEQTTTASRLRKLGTAKAPPPPSVDEVTDGVLVELGLKDAAPVAPEQAALRDMTATVLRGLGSVTGKTVTPEAASAPGRSLTTLVASALREGKTDSYIDALVNEAVGRGEIRVPPALVTSEGKVDTAVLLAGLVAKATKETGATSAAPTAAGGEGVELRMVQKADGAVEQYQFYTVQQGDSLGAIAVRFYGDINRYMKVYEANRMILSSPDLIRVGQRLVIPAA